MALPTSGFGIRHWRALYRQHGVNVIAWGTPERSPAGAAPIVMGNVRQPVGIGIAIANSQMTTVKGIGVGNAKNVLTIGLTSGVAVKVEKME